MRPDRFVCMRDTATYFALRGGEISSESLYMVGEISELFPRSRYGMDIAVDGVMYVEATAARLP